MERVEPEKDFGFVSVAAGDGLKALFADLGCDQVVSGGQTMNPSTDDILNAIEATPAKTVFVLPNNKNIIHGRGAGDSCWPTARCMSCRPGPFLRALQLCSALTPMPMWSRT